MEQALLAFIYHTTIVVHYETAVWCPSAFKDYKYYIIKVGGRSGRVGPVVLLTARF